MCYTNLKFLYVDVCMTNHISYTKKGATVRIKKDESIVHNKILGHI